MSESAKKDVPPGFQCDYAPRGRRRCPPSICDCFVDTHPVSPFDLHPEAFVVGRFTSPASTEDPA